MASSRFGMGFSFDLMMPTAPLKSCSGKVNGILTAAGRPRLNVRLRRLGLLADWLLLDQRAAAVLDRPERLIARHFREHLVIVPRCLRLLGLLHLEQEHAVHH